MTATLVLTNGRFHTMDPANPTTNAIAIRDGRILATGRDADMKALLSQDGEWLDLNGRSVTPGLVDAHVHFQGYALHLQRIQLHQATSLADALDRISFHLKTDHRSPITGSWLQGRGWAQDEWQDRAFPTAAALDAVCPDQPACFQDKAATPPGSTAVPCNWRALIATRPIPPAATSSAMKTAVLPASCLKTPLIWWRG
ncbi:MAG: amidohydrolase family protein [Chloroflexi bacterium]|nr:amidohydrolase family protein [Chloroflexota bacterium]